MQGIWCMNVYYSLCACRCMWHIYWCEIHFCCEGVFFGLFWNVESYLKWVQSTSLKVCSNIAVKSSSRTVEGLNGRIHSNSSTPVGQGSFSLRCISNCYEVSLIHLKQCMDPRLLVNFIKQQKMKKSNYILLCLFKILPCKAIGNIAQLVSGV